MRSLGIIVIILFWQESLKGDNMIKLKTDYVGNNLSKLIKEISNTAIGTSFFMQGYIIIIK